jgi:uncharacterized protein YdaU (DUF1376 family)
LNYYQFHIGDWALHTSHLTLEEDAVYRRLIDFYYDSESPIPTETQPVIRRLRLGLYSETVALILGEFFTLEVDGWHNYRADKEIAAYKAKATQAQENGKRGGRPPRNRAVETQPVILANPEITGSKANQEPITNNQEPTESKAPCDRQAESLDLLGAPQENKPEQVRIPYDKILAAFREKLPSFPQPRKLDADRMKAVRLIWMKETEYGSLDFFERYFGYVAQSPFLMGEKDWKACNFDWIFNAKNFRKIIEGTYHKESNNA